MAIMVRHLPSAGAWIVDPGKEIQKNIERGYTILNNKSQITIIGICPVITGLKGIGKGRLYCLMTGTADMEKTLSLFQHDQHLFIHQTGPEDILIEISVAGVSLFPLVCLTTFVRAFSLLIFYSDYQLPYLFDSGKGRSAATGDP